MADASINPISTVMAMEMQKGSKETATNSVSRLDNEITPAKLADLKAILEPFLAYPIVETKVKETGLLVED